MSGLSYFNICHCTITVGWALRQGWIPTPDDFKLLPAQVRSNAAEDYSTSIRSADDVSALDVTAGTDERDSSLSSTIGELVDVDDKDNDVRYSLTTHRNDP